MINVNYQIWFKVCKPIKHRYGLSTNCLMVLNGVYVYSKYKNNSFTRRCITDFVSYYDNKRITKYIQILLDHKYIIEAGIKNKRFQLYSLSPPGLQVIKELNKSYEEEIYKFCSLYNISL